MTMEYCLVFVRSVFGVRLGGHFAPEKSEENRARGTSSYLLAIDGPIAFPKRRLHYLTCYEYV